MSDPKYTDEELKKVLSPEEFQILRRKGTEAPFTGALLHNDAKGTYNCKVCNRPLFDSDTKFESNSGWPSFYDVKSNSAIKLKPEWMFPGWSEVTCANCGSHLGHVYDKEKGQPTGMRYCINSTCLVFNPSDKKK